MLRVDVVTLFEPMFDAVGRHGITGRALERGLWALRCWNPRTFATDAYRTIDDRPYGGGPGMVMMAEPLAAAFDAIAADRAAHGLPREVCGPTICLSPQGAPVTHRRMQALARERAVTLLCGRYEGIDQRLLDTRVDEELSVGDFVVSGGELPAMMLIDAAVRLLPGSMNDAASVEQDSFATGLLDCPHYTRPEDFHGLPVPPVLLSGHHAKIARWRRDRALEATWRRRPDLIDRARADALLDKTDEAFLATLRP